MIDGSEKRNRQLAFELQNSHVCEKRSKSFSKAVHSHLQTTDHLNRSLHYWQTTKMAGAPAKCSFAGIANITCGSLRGKDESVPLNTCVVASKKTSKKLQPFTYERYRR